MAVLYKLATIIKSSSDGDEFLLQRQTPPPKFGHHEYDSYVDSDLYDLPSARLNLLPAKSQNRIVVRGADSCSASLDLGAFDVDSAVAEVLEQLGFRHSDGLRWTFWKHVEEPEFGPGSCEQTVFLVGQSVSEIDNLRDTCMWMSIKTCLNWLVDVKPSHDRVGPLAVCYLNDQTQALKLKLPSRLRHQEYPPGVVLVPMASRTQKPFHTTNLVVFAPQKAPDYCVTDSFSVHGDALIIDPGCRSEFHQELMEIVAALPRKLVVFLTHHHCDHIDGLSVIQKCNPHATIVAHENTIRRIGKGEWSLGYTSVSRAEVICIGSQRLTIIIAPGHTDGHIGLLHDRTNSLIVGDHCVGHGSAVLDITSGGNISDYFQTTYNFMELSPHALIPMHGRVNLWPKHMLCSYMMNRRNREFSILKAIENGTKTLLDIVSNVYGDVDSSLWIPAASNVRLHVEHLAKQQKIPEEFSLENFRRSCVLFEEKLGQGTTPHLTS